MATFTQQISSTANDGADFNASSYIDDGVGVGVGYTSGLRFTSVSVPSGATITSAYLKIYSNNDGGANSVTGVVTGVTGNCPVMGNPNFPSTRPQTTASVALITGNTLTLRTHDVTAIVQEIVNGTWAAGNAMGFILKQTGGSGTQWYQDFIQSSTQCGLLEITYASPYPELIGSVAGTASQSATSVNLSSLTANGRYGIIAVMTANQSLAAPSGWTEVVPASGSPFRGTAGAAGGVRLTLFARPLDGTETSVSIGDSGDIQYPVAFVFAGQGGASVAIEASIAGNNTGTSASFTGVTTGVGDCLICTFVATDRDASGASWSAQANASLANLTERFDNGTATGTGGGIMLVTGEKQAAGATGSTTATHAANVGYAWITIAFKNGSTATALTPTGITSTPTVGNPALSQNHAVTPTAVTSTATLGNPALGQNHGLTATGITSTPTLGSPAFAITVTLSPVGLETTATLGSPALGQTHVLTATGLLSVPTLGSPAISQTHALVVSVLTSTPVLGAPVLAQTHALVPQELTVTATLGSPAFGQTHVFVATGFTTTPTLGSPALSEDSFVLSPVGIEATPVLGSPAFGQTHGLTATGLTSAPTVGSPALAENGHALTPTGLTVTPVVGNPVLAQTHVLTATGLVSTPVLGSPAMVITGTLVPQGLSVTPVLGSPALGQRHTLVGASITVTPVVGSPALGTQHVLTIPGLTVTPDLGTPEVGQVHVLAALELTVTPVLGSPAIHNFPGDLKIARRRVATARALSRIALAQAPVRIKSAENYPRIAAALPARRIVSGVPQNRIAAAPSRKEAA